MELKAMPTLFRQQNARETYRTTKQNWVTSEAVVALCDAWLGRQLLVHCWLGVLNLLLTPTLLVQC